MKNSLKDMFESMLSENDVVGITGIVPVEPTVIAVRDYNVPTEPEDVKEKVEDVYCVEASGKVIWEGSAKDAKEAIKKASEESDEDFGSHVKVYKKSKVNEEDVTSLSPKSFRTLYNCFIAEKMIDESVEIDETLKGAGLVVEGKLTPKGKEYLNKYLPTLFAS